MLSCIYEILRLDCKYPTQGIILLLLPFFVLKRFTAVQDKVCFPPCVRARWYESSNPMPSSLYFFSSSSRLSAHLLFPLPCCYDGPASPSWPNMYLSIPTGKYSVQVERVQMIVNDILIQRSTKGMNSCWHLWVLFLSWLSGTKMRNWFSLQVIQQSTELKANMEYMCYI